MQETKLQFKETGIGEEEALGSASGKGSYSNSCEIMGSGEVSRWCVKGAQPSGHGWDIIRAAECKTKDEFEVYQNCG